MPQPGHGLWAGQGVLAVGSSCTNTVTLCTISSAKRFSACCHACEDASNNLQCHQSLSACRGLQKLRCMVWVMSGMSASVACFRPQDASTGASAHFIIVIISSCSYVCLQSWNRHCSCTLLIPCVPECTTQGDLLYNTCTFPQVRDMGFAYSVAHSVVHSVDTVYCVAYSLAFAPLCSCI